MSWFKITTSKEQMDSGTLFDLTEAFDHQFKKSKKLSDMALFADNQTSNNTVLCISPSGVKNARQIIEAYSGTPCPQPDKLKTAPLLAGDYPVSYLG